MENRKYYEAYDDRYRQVHAENLQWFSQEPSGILLEMLEKYKIGKEARLLELGCGEGRDAAELLRRGYSLLATDISEEAISFCRKQFGFESQFQVLDCVRECQTQKFKFIYAISVLHMLVEDVDRKGMLKFIKEHLQDEGFALICTMGDGITERTSDIASAFKMQKRIHERTGKTLYIAGTSYRGVSFETLKKELHGAGLQILEQGITEINPDYWKVMYAVVRKQHSVE